LLLKYGYNTVSEIKKNNGVNKLSLGTKLEKAPSSKNENIKTK